MRYQGLGLSNSYWRKGGGVRTTEDSTLILLLIAVSLAFAWILWPFFGAILWAIVFATVFAPPTGVCWHPCASAPTSLPLRPCCLS